MILNSTDGIFKLDSNCAFEYVNPMFVEITGITLNELLGGKD
ncbi:MAG TPA: hypothetical protein EYP86_02540 [Candidatus Altiarchaeales archaeon]|nr:hypothetical protein [Candidatus Altiarchaeales archaeon]